METITYFYTHKNLQDSPNYNIKPEQITQFRINMLVDISKRKVHQHGYNQHPQYTINITQRNPGKTLLPLSPEVQIQKMTRNNMPKSHYRSGTKLD